jgi:hypothetical protein
MWRFNLKIRAPALHESPSLGASDPTMHRIDIFFPFVLPRVKDISRRSYLLCPANAPACSLLASSFGGIEVAVGLIRRGAQERAGGEKL